MFDSFNGDFDIQKEHINNCGEYVVTSGLTDDGILGKSDVNAKIFDNGTITVDMFGNVFYRQFKYKIVTHARVFSLKPKMKITDNQGLFISNALFFLKFSYGWSSSEIPPDAMAMKICVLGKRLKQSKYNFLVGTAILTLILWKNLSLSWRRIFQSQG